MGEVSYKERFCWLDFQRVEITEKKELLDFLKEHTDFDGTEGSEDVHIIKTPLVFYENVFLYIIQDHRPRDSQRQLQTEILIHKKPDEDLLPQQLYPLYRRANEIHSFNKFIGFKLTSVDQAAAYLRFFTEAIEGTEGPFYIIDRPNYYPGSILSKADSYDIDTALEEHAELITPIEERVKTKDHFFYVQSAVLHGDTLFKASFRLKENGEVFMTGDKYLEPAVNLSHRTTYDYDPFPIYKNIDCLTIDNEAFKNALLSDTPDQLYILLQLIPPDPDTPTNPKPFVKIKGEVLMTGATINFPLYTPSWLTLVFESNIIFNKCSFVSDVNFGKIRVLNGIVSFVHSKVSGSLKLNNAIIYSPIFPNFPNNTLGLICKNMQIGGDFRANEIKIFHRGVSFDNSLIKGSLIMEKAEVDHDISFFKTRIRGWMNLYKSTIRKSLNLNSAVINSDCALNQIRVHKGINCRSAKIGTALSLSGAYIMGNVSFNFAEIGGLLSIHLKDEKITTIGGNLELSALNCHWGHIEIIGVHIQGSLIMISPHKIGSFYLRGETIGVGGFSKFISAEVDWGVYISNLQLRGNFNCYGLRVGGTRNIPTKKIDQGNFQLVNSSIQGAVNFSQPPNMPDNLAYYLVIDSKRYDVLGLGQKQHGVHGIKFNNSINLFNSDFSQFLHLTKDTILDYVRFCLYHLYTRKHKEIYLVESVADLIWDTEFNKNKRKEIFDKIKPLRLLRQHESCFEIEAAYLDHDRHLHTGTISIHTNATTIGEHLHIKSEWQSKKRLKIPMDELFRGKPFYLSQTFTDVGNFWTEITGNKKSEFLKDVSENSLFDASKYYNSLYSLPLPFFKKGTLYAAKSNLVALKYPTEVQSNFVFNGVSIIGNISLNNIKVAKQLKLLQTKIVGDISIKALAATFSQKDYLEYAVCSQAELPSLEVKGDADFSGLRIIKRGQYAGDFYGESMVVNGTLNFYNKSLQTQLQLNGTLDLSNASIENLALSETTFAPTQKEPSEVDHVLNLERLNAVFFDWKGGFPDHLVTKIRDLEVGAWSEDGLNNLKAILKADTSAELKRNAYTKIENTLRNQGYDEKAEEVYKEMWQRIKRQRIDGKQKPWKNRLLFGFRSWFGYGRKQAYLCLWIFLISILISSFIFSNRENIVAVTPETELEPIYRNNDIPEHPHKEEWGTGNSLWFTLRYHIPIIPFTALQQWEPNPKGLNFFGLRSSKFTAQHYAHIMELSHWIIWSIFLIYLSGILRRGEGK